MDPKLLRAIADAHDWHEALGNRTVDGRFCRFVQDPDHPEVWSSNHVSGVTASSPGDIDEFLTEMDERFAYSPFRVVTVDAFTPPSCVARLAFEDYREQTLVILMALEGDIVRMESPKIAHRPVESEADWRDLHDLLVIDHREGARTGRTPLAEDVTEGLFESLRRKAGACQVFLAEIEGRPCAYAAAVQAPHGLGLVEDVFTLPSQRRRGIASAMIGHCVRYVRERGAGVVFLGAHASEPPKRLYARLGFAPAMVARRFVKTIG